MRGEGEIPSACAWNGDGNGDRTGMGAGMGMQLGWEWDGMGTQIK